MSQASSENTTPLPVTRQAVEAQIDALIDLLDTLDGDTDLEPDLTGYSTGMDSREGDDSDAEPSLGFTDDSYNPTQVGSNFTANANAGDDREGDHDGREPDEDGEYSLGWCNEGSQSAAAFAAFGSYGDLEDGTGPVRKKRPKSKTGGAVYRGCGVLSQTTGPVKRRASR